MNKINWLDTAFDCEYIDANTHRKLSAEVEQVGCHLGSMIKRDESFCF